MVKTCPIAKLFFSCETIRVFLRSYKRQQKLLFADDAAITECDVDSIKVKLSQMQLCRPRSFGDCWLGCELWHKLGLDEYWADRLDSCHLDISRERYVLLTQVEAAFKSLKSNLAVRPVYHQLEHRVEAHIFVAFLAYCLMITLRQKLRYYAPGLTARDVLDKLSAIMMIDVRIPTTDGRMLEMRRYSQPELEQRIILDKLKMNLPKQPPPKVYSHQLNRKLCGGN